MICDQCDEKVAIRIRSNLYSAGYDLCKALVAPGSIPSELQKALIWSAQALLEPSGKPLDSRRIEVADERVKTYLECIGSQLRRDKPMRRSEAPGLKPVNCKNKFRKLRPMQSFGCARKHSCRTPESTNLECSSFA